MYVYIEENAVGVKLTVIYHVAKCLPKAIENLHYLISAKKNVCLFLTSVFKTRGDTEHVQLCLLTCLFVEN